MFKKTREELIEFEKHMVDVFKEGVLPFLIHYSGGNENSLIEIFKDINDGDYIFSTHRSHYHYLLAGGEASRLEEKIRKGKSMFIFDKKLNFLSSSILAGTCSIAAGVALSLKLKKSEKTVWCFIGDGAEDEGHFYEAVKYVHNLGLPCKFIIEDNNRSVESSKEMRGSTKSIVWPDCVMRYHYTPTFPHAGPGLKEMINFNKQIVENYIDE